MAFQRVVQVVAQDHVAQQGAHRAGGVFREGQLVHQRRAVRRRDARGAGALGAAGRVLAQHERHLARLAALRKRLRHFACAGGVGHQQGRHVGAQQVLHKRLLAAGRRHGVCERGQARLQLGLVLQKP